MKRKDLQNIKTKTAEELSKMADALSGQIVKVALELKGRKLKNTNTIKNLRRDLAQIVTVRQQTLLESREK